MTNPTTYPHESAYPVKMPNADGRVVISEGLTKREAFAMAAMQGLCACPLSSDNGGGIADYAKDSVKLADALIVALNKES